jgi:hypothetical protein
MSEVGFLRPIRQGYKTGEGLVFLQPLGDLAQAGQLFEVGDLDSLAVNAENTRKERYSSQVGPRELADSQLDTTKLSVSFTMLQMTAFNRALAVGAGTPNSLVQSALTAATFVIANAVIGGKYWIGTQGVTVTGVMGGATALLDTDYEVDGATGMIHLLSKPEAATLTLVTVTYNRKATLLSDKVFDAGFMSKPEAEYRMFIRGTHAFGPKAFTLFNRVRLAPDGEREYIGEDYSTVSMSGEILPDDSVPYEYRFGFERDLILPIAA